MVWVSVRKGSRGRVSTYHMTISPRSFLAEQSGESCPLGFLNFLKLYEVQSIIYK